MNRLELPAHAVRYDRSPLLKHTGGALRPGGLELTQRLAVLAGLRSGDLVLDLACGAGVSAAHLTESSNVRVLGLDLSHPLLCHGHERSEGPLLCQGGADCLPLGDETVDAVLCECALSLFPQPEIVLAEVRRVLRPNGKLLLSDVYAREPVSSSVTNERAEACRCCVDGAQSHGGLLQMLARNGLDVQIYEDHTKHLKQLAGELIFVHGSLEAFWQELLPGGCARSVTGRAARVRLGYYLLVAKMT